MPHLDCAVVACILLHPRRGGAGSSLGHTALAEVPINKTALIDAVDFITREESVLFNQAGLDLVWNFVTTAGAMTQTAVTPTDTVGDYDWVNQGNGLYTIELPASGGASINIDTEGCGWFSGFATGILPWRGPVCGFRIAALNNAFVDGDNSFGNMLNVNVLEIEGFDPRRGMEGFPRFRLAALASDEALAAFIDVLDWMVAEIRAVESSG